MLQSIAPVATATMPLYHCISIKHPFENRHCRVITMRTLTLLCWEWKTQWGKDWPRQGWSVSCLRNEKIWEKNNLTKSLGGSENFVWLQKWRLRGSSVGPLAIIITWRQIVRQCQKEDQTGAEVEGVSQGMTIAMTLVIGRRLSTRSNLPWCKNNLPT